MELPLEASIHLVFHVSQLKKVVGDKHQVQSSTPNFSDLFEWVIEPEEAFGYGWNPSTGMWEVLIGWKGLPEFEAAWEIMEDYQQPFPDFHLQDKVFLEAGGNDRPPILLKYHRRSKKGMTYVMGSVASTSNSKKVGPTVS